jgi:hypothetical protein
MIAGQFSRIEQRVLGGRMPKPGKDLAGGGDTKTDTTKKAANQDHVPNSNGQNAPANGGGGAGKGNQAPAKNSGAT